MSDNHRLVKDVSHALKHYIDVRRKEEAFDLSGVYTPPYDIHRYRLNTNFGYAGVHDAQLKNYFPKNEFKKIFSEESNQREKFFRNELIYHLKGTERRKKSRAVSSKNTREKKQQKLLPNRSRSKSASLRPATAYIPLGLLSIRSKPLPFLTKGEKKRVIQTTSMILSATDEVFHKEKIVKITKRIDTDKTRENDQYLQEYIRVQTERDKEESVEYDSVKKDSTSDDISEPVLIEEKPKKQPKKPKATETEDIDFNVNTLLEAYEVKSGPKLKYVITVVTGARPGSSTQATIKIKLFGDRFDNYIKATKWITLDKSRTHKIPFQKGNEDEFQIEIFDIGILRAITIGHMEKEIKYSWFLEKVNIHEPVKDINYEFIFHKWFSQCTEDQKHIRTAFLTRAGYIPKPDKKLIGVVKTPQAIPKQEVKEEFIIQNIDLDIYQPQKSGTQSEYVNASSTASTKTQSSSSTSSSTTQLKEVFGYVPKDNLSSSGSSTPRDIVNTQVLEPTLFVIGKKPPVSSSSSSSSGSSSAIEVHKRGIEVHSTASSSSSSSFIEVHRNSSSDSDHKKVRRIGSSSSSSNSSSATITPRNNAPEPVIRRKSTSPISNSSSRTSTNSSNKKDRETNLVVQTIIATAVVRRPESRSESSTSSKNGNKEKHSTDSESKKSGNLKYTTEFDMKNLPEKPKPEIYHIHKTENPPQSNVTAVVATVVAKPRKASTSSDSSSSSSSSSSLTSSSSSSSTSSTSSISVQKPVVKYNRNSSSTSPDGEMKLKEMSVKAFKLVSQNDIEGLKKLINGSSKIILSRNSEEETLLSVACKKGYNQIVKFLVETDDLLLTIDTPEGFCPIHFCATSNNLEGLKILFENGASLDSQTYGGGSTALHLASIGGFSDICKYLVSKNAKIDIKDGESKTPVDYASNNEALLEFLKKSKKINTEDQKRYSTQMSIQSNATDKELAELEANENYTAKSPFGRPERPAPITENLKDSGSESESEIRKPVKNEAIRSNQPSSLNDYTTIVKTNESKGLEDLIKKVEMHDTESSESEKKITKPKLSKRKESTSSISSSSKNEVKQPNMGKMTNSLSDKTSTASSESIKLTKPNDKRKILKESVLSD